MNSVFRILTTLWIWAIPCFSQNDGSGLNISVAGDLVSEVGLTQSSNGRDRLDARGLELLFYAPVDPIFDARASLAAHMDSAGPTVALHELYFGSSKLIPRSRFRIGQFFLGVGRLNQFHAHDWPFISAPKIHRLLFDGRDSILAEGAIDAGIEYSYLLPVSHFIELTLGITNGWTFGHSHVLGIKPAVPTHYARLATYFGLPWNGGTQIGLNYLDRSDSSRTRTTIMGVDLTAKWRRARLLSFLLQSEFWFQQETPQGGNTTRTFGGYVYPQVPLGGNFLFGTRLDYFTLATPNLAGVRSTVDTDYSFVPTVTYESSEFAKLRLAYHFRSQHTPGVTTRRHLVELQAIFLLGAHPAHDF